MHTIEAFRVTDREVLQCLYNKFLALRTIGARAYKCFEVLTMSDPQYILLLRSNRSLCV